MSFYGGRPGKSFTIDRVFKNYIEMYQEAQDSAGPDILSTSLDNYYISGVPIGSFVLISYGMGSTDDPESDYYKNRYAELQWFKENPDKVPGYAVAQENERVEWYAAADYNATLWLDMPWADGADYNASVWVKRWSEEKGYYYEYLANVGGILPEILDGYWYIGQNNTGVRAEGRQVEFRVEYDRQTATYALLSREKPIARTAEIEYGLSNLSEKFIYNEFTQNYEYNLDGEYIFVYLSNSSGTFVYGDNEQREEIGYTKSTDWQGIQLPEEPKFSSDFLQWKFEDEEEWHDLFEITGLTNIYNYMDEAAASAQSARDTLDKINAIDLKIEIAQEEIEKTADKLEGAVAGAQGYAEASENSYLKTKDLIDTLNGDISSEDIPLTELQREVQRARGSGEVAFAELRNRLDNYPYQFDTIADMKKCIELSRGNRCFTFGIDEVGNDDSKLFGIFDPSIEEDKLALEAVDEDGEKIIAEQELLGNGLIAGLLTVFSGKGGGGGGGTVGSISVTVDTTTVKSGGIVTFSCYYTNGTRGPATLFVRDGASGQVIDAINPSKNYTKGVAKAFTDVGQTYTFTWKPADGVHNLTFSALCERDGLYTNEQQMTVTVGGISISTHFQEGSTFTSNNTIAISYDVKTIYRSDFAVVQYETYQNGVLREDLTGQVESKRMGTSQNIVVEFKQSSTTSIGTGAFRVVARAYMKNDPDTFTEQLVRNFIITEANTIYLITTHTSDTVGYAGEVFLMPLTLQSTTGSRFTVTGEYSTESGFIQGEGTKFPNSATLTTKGSFYFPVTFQDVGTYYMRFYATGVGISATGMSEEITLVVEPAEDKWPVYDTGLVVNLDANKGQTNETDRGTWRNLVMSSDGTYKNSATLYNFNYGANGWDVDSAGLPTGYLYCNSKAYARINLERLFTNMGSGVTVECVFKAADIGRDQTILSLPINGDNNNAGLFITKDKATANIGNTSVTARFNVNGIDPQNDETHIAFVLWKKDSKVEEEKSGRSGYIKIYINGVMSGATKMPVTIAAQENNHLFLNCNSFDDVNLRTFGVAKYSAVRVYNVPLTDNQILRNYIHNLRDVYDMNGNVILEKEQRQLQVASKNELTEDADQDDIIPESKSIPSMTFYLTKDEWEQMTKDNKFSITVKYYDPKDDSTKIWYNVKTCWQGTSSIAYPVKNFKIKLGKDLKGKKQKYSLGGKTFKENTFCLKADYMDSSHVHNTGNANFIHDAGIISNYSLTPPQAEELGISPAAGYKGLKAYNQSTGENVQPGDLKTRTSIYGFPILLYIAIATIETENLPLEERTYNDPIFWGIYNFNLDKGSNESWGLYREDKDTDELTKYQDCTSFEIAANSGNSAGGFHCIKFVKHKTQDRYGWTRPTVKFFQNEIGDYQINNQTGTLWEIANAGSDGAIMNAERELSDTYKGIEYEGWYNKGLLVKGYAIKDARYIYNVNNNTYTRDDVRGTYIHLYEIDPMSFKLQITDDGQLVEIGYYEYASQMQNWSHTVLVNANVYDAIENWQIQEALPPIKDYYYEYYIRDLELRFPDADCYLYQTNSGEGQNALYYKEYDKIIPLIEWVDDNTQNRGSNKVDPAFLNGIAEHVDKNTAFSYFLLVYVVGLIDNFGKNLMFDTWGYDKDGNIPYLTKTIGDTVYHKVWKFESNWDEDAEIYTDEGSFRYGLMDITNLTEDGKYYVYESDESYSILGDLILNGKSDAWDFGNIKDDRTVGWYHEIDNSKLIWYPHAYDLDSCLGLDNLGNLTFTPSIEMTDTDYINAKNNLLVPATPFNTSTSLFWYNLITGFESEINSRYQDLISSGTFTTQTFNKIYNTDIIETLGERWYNEDSYPKYLSNKPIKVVINSQETYRYPSEFTSIAYGTDWQRIKTWIEHRMNYLSSMFNREDIKDTANAMTFRAARTGVVFSYEIETYEPMYMKLIPQNGANAIYTRVRDYNSKIILRSDSQVSQEDQEMWVSPATNIKSIKEANRYPIGQLTPGDCPRLLDLDLSGSASLKAINWPTNTQTYLLQNLNLSNCVTFADTVNGTNFPLLTHVDLSNTLAPFTFNPRGGILQTAKLSSNTQSLDIQNYYELEDVSLDLKYPETVSAENDAQKNHSTELGSIKLINCPNLNFSINALMPSVDGTSWVPLSSTQNTWITRYVNNYGIFSLFQNLTNLQIQNSLKIPAVTDADGKIHHELILCNASLNYVSVTDSEIDKIALVAKNNCYVKSLLNSTVVGYSARNAAYPGTGQSPLLKDAEMGEDGLSCDSNITELEIRESNYSTFELPWRVNLGTLIGLRTLKFNVRTISVKQILSEDSVRDQEYLGIGYNGNTTPQRFELILPIAKRNEETGELEGIQEIYINPNITALNFTCIRRPDDVIDYLNVGSGINSIPEILRNQEYNTTVGVQKYFSGIDLIGCTDQLVMSFKGFQKITGIMGMSKLSYGQIYNKYGATALEGLFKNCSRLIGLFTDNQGIYDFSDLTTDFETFTSYKEMFYGCASLRQEYIAGFKTINNRRLRDVSSMFYGCNTLIDVDFSWKNTDKLLSNVNSLFQNCKGLKTVNLTIFNVDTSRLTSLNNLFYGCTSLTEPIVQLYADANGRVSNISEITSMNNMFYNCESLNKINFSRTGLNWDFNKLQTATNWFRGCKELTSIVFPASTNFTSLSDLNSAFYDCIKLTDIFNHSKETCWQFNDGLNTDSLNLSNLFTNCRELEDIGEFMYCDMQRVNNIASIFSGCIALLGSSLEPTTSFNAATLDLTNWNFGSNVINLNAAFSGCSTLQNIKFPKITVSGLSQTFQNCSRLRPLDVTNITLNPDGNVSLAQAFYNCSYLGQVAQGGGEGTSSFKGYENWNVENVTSTNSMFYGCQRLPELDLKNWRFKKLANMSSMFYNCRSLRTIYGLRNIFGDYNEVQDISYPNTQATLTSVEALFSGCNNLELGLSEDENIACDLRNWGYVLRGVQSVRALFQDCYQITDLTPILSYPNSTTTVRVSEFINVISMKDFVSGCSKLATFDYFNNRFKFTYTTASGLQDISSMVSGCSQLLQFLFAPTNCSLDRLIETGTNNLFTGCTSLYNVQLPANHSLRVSLDLSGARAMTRFNLSNCLMNLATDSIYDFTTGPAADNNIYGKIKISSAQASSIDTTAVGNLFVQKGWSLASGN